MMVFLPGDTWIRLIVWLLIGLAIYFGYSRYHSKLQHGQFVEPIDPVDPLNPIR
jgi:hypothetical protein